MAPSLPGTAGRRTTTGGSSASSAGTVKREGSVKRRGRPRRAAETQESDSESTPRGSPSGRRPTRKASSRSSTRQEAGDLDEDGSEEEEDEDGQEAAVEDAAEDAVEDTVEETSVPPEDLEEIEGEIDEAGETKVTKDGELLGGRQYKCKTFKLPERGDRIYMLSMDPARVLGFRDSYLFFLKNPQLVRVNTTVEERRWMIENGMLMANFKSKLIAVVTARSIFKSFGARIIKNGRSRVDDYYEANATEEDALDESDGDMSRNADDQNRFGRANGGGEGTSMLSKRKLMHDDATRHITDLNWQYESAMAVRALNSRLKILRTENPRFLDPHTNIEQIPKYSQPNRCVVLTAEEDHPADSTARPVSSGESEGSSDASAPPAVVSVPRSIGPVVEAAVKIEIKGGMPPPPFIHDPNVWAAIPEEIQRQLEEAETAKAMEEEDDNEDMTRYPLSILSGQYQAAYPM
ncbi:chromatin remodelling complex Rsc7/Swp82 subunit-domain-containing protein [Gamsiella multidivaricata]|uniref:chromatin remodelling complex Rsc7/Swp82 subunit-domain-containing protein n=1 Tax=Gamsiella multidivaricata TaxID=101098 RepID=UPI00221E5EAF|nr:chromatin remodelling complex Rsc7/Swp82 subunit-domain-containing protein [Gamsiella multidivaricata]KAI7825213.1 chromatin remodelling complex Rsc7/Swp82 subunit-domain-containing protein [Gamsiella multidivaricata]